MSDELEMQSDEEFDEESEWEEIEGGKPRVQKPPKSLLDAMCRAKERVQRTRIQLGNMIGACERGGWEEANISEIRYHFDKIRESEERLTNIVNGTVHARPMWQYWLVSVKGIGEAMAGPLLEYLDPTKPHVSSWYRYVGLDVDNASGDEGHRDATRRKRGEKTGWNPYLKRHMFKIGNQFIKAKGQYGDEYQRAKRAIQERVPELRDIGRAKLWILEEPIGRFKPGRLLIKKVYARVAVLLAMEGRTTIRVRRRPLNIHLMAMRVAVKLFLSHFHEKWREQLGLPKDPPYPMTQGHTGYVPPAE